jgi:fatty-acyl-CoA synthase
MNRFRTTPLTGDHPMLGLMQQQSLLISSLIDFAEKHHGDSEIVSRRVEGDIHRYAWADVARRSRQVANALDAQQVPQGARIATLAWNGYRHLELYFGVSGSGRVLHTMNPRLHPEQLAWIANHAEDQVLCFDMTFLPLVQAVHAHCKTITHYVALCDADKLPADTGIPNLVSYEAWMGQQPSTYAWPELDENTACSLCYTSGTTGNPKGALYSQRSTVLHAYAAALPDSMCISARDSILPVVPMFHVNAWGIPYSAAMAGAKLVFPGPALDGSGCAHRVANAAGPHGSSGPEVQHAGPHCHWRLGLSTGHDRRLPAELQRGRSPCLGHDRAQPLGHGVHPEKQAPEFACRCPNEAAHEARPLHFWHRHEDRGL